MREKKTTHPSFIRRTHSSHKQKAARARKQHNHPNRAVPAQSFIPVFKPPHITGQAINLTVKFVKRKT
jgi:hypothetical protein